MSHEPSSTPSFSASRRWFIAFHVLLGIVAMAALVAMANYLAVRHFWRRSFVAEDREQLSSTTRQVLASLTNDVQVVIYFRPDEPLYPYVRSLLKQYADASPRIKLQSVNYLTEPGKAEQVKVDYKLPRTAKDVVVFAANGRVEVVGQGELSELDVSQLVSGQGREVRRKAFLGERFFTSKLMLVANPKPHSAYYLFRHKEHDPTSDGVMGYKKFAETLYESNIQVRPLDLLRSPEVPADCDLLIIAGPVDDFQTGELEKLERFLTQGGRLFLLLNFQSPASLQPLLAKWGVALGRDVVYDEPNMQNDSLLILDNLGNHPIVRPIAQAVQPVAMVLPRSVGPLAGGRGADGAEVTELILTGPQGVARSDFRPGVTLPYPSARDRRGTLPLAVAVEKGGIKNVKLDRGAGRLVVTGDSLFLNNDMIRAPGNQEFGRQAVNWLLDRSQLLGTIGPRAFTEYTLVVTEAQMTTLAWLLLGGLPGAVLGLGLLVWWRRRG